MSVAASGLRAHAQSRRDDMGSYDDHCVILRSVSTHQAPSTRDLMLTPTPLGGCVNGPHTDFRLEACTLQAASGLENSFYAVSFANFCQLFVTHFPHVQNINSNVRYKNAA